MADKKSAVWRQETEKLKSCLDEVQKNIDLWSEKKKEIDKRTKDLYDHYHYGNPELESDLIVSLDRQNEAGKTLRRNLLAKSKPYFGRIDFTEERENKAYSLYIGKNGITRSDNSVLITDWRAPVSSVYYESGTGRSGYEAPAGRIAIDLALKRTYEIDESCLYDYYDTDVIANDEFLMKYLSKNKEVILGEIISTIQKEQDEIIRDTPWHNVIVQGVAGSGKTTVAMHRISYILYNYKERFKPSEFYIIGSNRMLLKYITGVLPDLDVYDANQMTMEELFAGFMGDNKISKKMFIAPIRSGAGFKGGIDFFRDLEDYLDQIETALIPTDPVLYNGKALMTTDDILPYITESSIKTAIKKAERLNDRLSFLLRNRLELEFLDPPELRAEMRKYKNHFDARLKKVNTLQIYTDYIMSLLHCGAKSAYDSGELNALLRQLGKKRFDLFDLCALALIDNRLLGIAGLNRFKHMVVDEAQDFGASVFYTLKKLLTDCTFTIMGDISQNINYHTGMNDWSLVRNFVFSPEQDRFYTLSKSYRNTVEISEYAGAILTKCSFETYKIEPVIRHGKPVTVTGTENEAALTAETVNAIQALKAEAYSTLAVICRDRTEAESVYEKLSERVEVIRGDEENASFSKGVMVLPIDLTKGLEFDAVILYNPTAANYPATDADAKLLYVAVTRALHELRIVHTGTLSELLTKEQD